MRPTIIPASLATAFVVFCASVLIAGESSGSGQIDSIVIKGTSRIDIKGDKPPYVPELDPLTPVRKHLADQLKLPVTSSKILLNLPNFLPSRVESSVVLTPWHTQLAEPPFLDLKIKTPRRIRVRRWRLVITDDKGDIFRTIKGKGNLPERLTWDGRSDSGDMLRVGRPYAYSYHILDKEKVPHYFRGSTVLFRGIVGKHIKSLAVSIDTDFLFVHGDQLSKTGEAFLREAQDVLRGRATGSIKVTVYASEIGLANKRAAVVRRYLVKALQMPRKAVTSRARKLSRYDPYARTEIVGK